MSKLMIVEVPSYSCEFKGIREVRELVCCRECRLNETDDCPMVYYTPLEDGGFETRWWNKPDDFCSWGEREGE